MGEMPKCYQCKYFDLISKENRKGVCKKRAPKKPESLNPVLKKVAMDFMIVRYDNFCKEHSYWEK